MARWRPTVGAELHRVQYGAGGGPLLDAESGDEPHLTADDPRTETRWPAFTAAASQHGVRAVLAPGFLHSGPAQPSGALTLYSRRANGLTAADRDAALLLVTHGSLAIARCGATEQTDLLRATMKRAIESRALVGQAKGILMKRRISIPCRLRAAVAASRRTARSAPPGVTEQPYRNESARCGDTLLGVEGRPRHVLLSGTRSGAPPCRVAALSNYGPTRSGRHTRGGRSSTITLAQENQCVDNLYYTPWTFVTRDAPPARCRSRRGGPLRTAGTRAAPVNDAPGVRVGHRVRCFGIRPSWYTDLGSAEAPGAAADVSIEDG